MARSPGLSVRLKLTLSYAGFVAVAGALLLAAVWVFLLRYVPRGETVIVHNEHLFVSPGRGELLRDFVPAAVVLGVFLVVFGLLGGWILAGRMLEPLARITDATRRASDGCLSHRIRLSGRQDEFRELADAFDTMLSRIEEQVDGQRRFAANASHELRTPLAVTQTVLDVARNDPHVDQRQLVDRLHRLNARAIGLTEALLLLSRADRRSFTPEPVELSLLAEEAVETLLPLADDRGIDIRISCTPTPTAGSEALLLQLVTNLVHNAIVHNLSPDGTVWVSTDRTDSGEVVLVVENTGEEVDQGLVDELTEPFLRGTARVKSDHAGVGLGLAIVESITRAHGGSLGLTARNDGGLRACVRLPAEPTVIQRT